MTTVLNKLRAHRTALGRECKNLLDNLGDKSWSAEDRTTYNAKLDEVERLDSQIQAHMASLEHDADVNFSDIGDFTQGRDDVRDRQRFGGSQGQGQVSPQARAAREMLARFMLGGWGGLSNDEARSVRAEVPGSRNVRNAQTVGTPASGGYTVQTDVVGSVVDQMAAFGGMRKLASNITTESGNDMQYPRTDGTSEEGELVGESTAATNQDMAFDAVTLKAYKFSSKVIVIPFELLQDTRIDIVGLLTRRLATRLGRITNRKFTLGSGTNEPQGLIPACSVGRTCATGNTTTVTYADLVELVESIDVAYDEGNNFAWQMHQASRKMIRKLTDSQGRPLWTPNYDEGITNMSGQAGDMLMNKPIVINNQMAQPGANAITMSFGAHDRYMIRDVMDLLIMRFDDSAYATKGQVGFLGWQRAGGALLDGYGVKTLKQSAT